MTTVLHDGTHIRYQTIELKRSRTLMTYCTTVRHPDGRSEECTFLYVPKTGYSVRGLGKVGTVPTFEEAEALALERALSRLANVPTWKVAL